MFDYCWDFIGHGHILVSHLPMNDCYLQLWHSSWNKSEFYLPCVLWKSCLDFSPHATILTFSPSLSAKAAFTALTKLEWIPPHNPRSDERTTIKLSGFVLSASLGLISTFSYKAKENMIIWVSQASGLWKCTSTPHILETQFPSLVLTSAPVTFPYIMARFYIQC